VRATKANWLAVLVGPFTPGMVAAPISGARSAVQRERGAVLAVGRRPSVKGPQGNGRASVYRVPGERCPELLRRLA